MGLSQPEVKPASDELPASSSQQIPKAILTVSDEHIRAALNLADEAHVVAEGIRGVCGGVGAKVPSSQPAS